MVLSSVYLSRRANDLFAAMTDLLETADGTVMFVASFAVKRNTVPARSARAGDGRC